MQPKKQKTNILSSLLNEIDRHNRDTVTQGQNIDDLQHKVHNFLHKEERKTDGYFPPILNRTDPSQPTNISGSVNKDFTQPSTRLHDNSNTFFGKKNKSQSSLHACTYIAYCIISYPLSFAASREQEVILERSDLGKLMIPGKSIKKTVKNP